MYYLFLFLLIQTSVFSQQKSSTQKIMSLTFGEKTKLESSFQNAETSWESNNQNIIVSEGQSVSIPEQTNKQITIKGTVLLTDQRKKIIDSIRITGVPWKSNLSSLKTIKLIKNISILGTKNDSLIFNYKNELFYSRNNLNFPNRLSPFYASNFYSSFLSTPFGQFIRDGSKIYKSNNLKDWSFEYETRNRGLKHSFDYKTNQAKDTCFLFTHDYSPTGQDTFPHSVYRGAYTKEKGHWEKIFTLFSAIDYEKNGTLWPFCRHIHTVAIDPFTGHIWMGTGDTNYQSHIFYSDNNGKTFNHVGFGSQDWRTLSIWFTENYIYWAMDASQPCQMVWRIDRKVYNKNGYWPDMTPELNSGQTKVGLKYFIHRNENKILPYKSGWFYVETKPRQLDKKNSVFVVDDPELNYKEIAIDLTNSALWGHMKVVDEKGDQLILLSANAEGQIKDNFPRIFGIKERIDGSLDVQELISAIGIDSYAQFYPYEQDKEGNIYYRGFNLESDDVYQMRLNWTDNSKTNGGYVIYEFAYNTTAIKLSLLGRDGNILKWQKGDEAFNWKDIDYQMDTMSVLIDKDISYYRAIVQKEDCPPVSSYPIKIEPKGFYTDSSSTKGISNQFMITPIPAQNYLCIQGKGIFDKDLSLELYNLQGICITSKRLAKVTSSFNELIEIPSHQAGIYLLKINGNTTNYSQKIILQ